MYRPPPKTVNHSPRLSSTPIPPPSHPSRLLIACLAEAALAPLAALVAWLFRIPIWQLAWPTGRIAEATLVGLAATLPMVAFFALLLRTNWPPLVGLRDQARHLVGRLTAGGPVWLVITLAIVAGVGEELLFRGALQPLLSRWTTPWTGVALAGLVFGLAHPMSRAYIVVAAIGGLYLGALAQWQGEVLSAIVAHSAYDIVALLWLGASRTS